MDSISNGLDSATTFDIVNAVKSVAETLDCTFVIALLQVYAIALLFVLILSSFTDLHLDTFYARDYAMADVLI